MSMRSRTRKHLADLYRVTTGEGNTGQSKTATLFNDDMQVGIHPRGSYQNTDNMQFGSETDVDFYFSYDPQTKIEDEFRNIRLADGTVLSPQITYKVDSAAVNLGARNRLWRVTCTIETNH